MSLTLHYVMDKIKDAMFFKKNNSYIFENNSYI